MEKDISRSSFGLPILTVPVSANYNLASKPKAFQLQTNVLNSLSPPGLRRWTVMW